MNAEERRLREAGSRRALASLGPVPQRTPVGHGPRGLLTDGTAWHSFPFDHAHSVLTDGVRTVSSGSADTARRLCFALALWNGRDAI